MVISVDTWRAAVGDAACRAGADVINDAWGGWDPDLAAVAAQHDAAIVCTHAGGVEPRTRPHRITYDDVVADVLSRTVALAERAVSLGVARESVLIDPGHDFGKNTRHSLEATRRLAELVATGWPVLVSLSNKDFVGEALGRPLEERLIGTLATTSVSAWLGRGCSARTTSPRRVRRWTWSPRSAARGCRRGRCADWRSPSPPSLIKSGRTTPCCGCTRVDHGGGGRRPVVMGRSV